MPSSQAWTTWGSRFRQYAGLGFGEVHSWSLRWLLQHLIVRTARHTGHADIIRETIDGGTWIPLVAAAERWPPDGENKPCTATGHTKTRCLLVRFLHCHC